MTTNGDLCQIHHFWRRETQRVEWEWALAPNLIVTVWGLCSLPDSSQPHGEREARSATQKPLCPGVTSCSRLWLHCHLYQATTEFYYQRPGRCVFRCMLRLFECSLSWKGVALGWLNERRKNANTSNTCSQHQDFYISEAVSAPAQAIMSL